MEYKKFIVKKTYIYDEELEVRAKTEEEALGIAAQRADEFKKATGDDLLDTNVLELGKWRDTYERDST